jgi:histidyl-tRNA synthetase
MQEVLEAVDVNDFLVKVNHRKILEGMIQEAGCRIEDFASICSSVDKLDKQPWSEIK